MLGAALGNLQGGIAFVHDILADAVDFVAEDEGQFLAGPAAKIPSQFERMFGLLDGEDAVTLCPELPDGLQRVSAMLPRHAVLGAEGCLVDFGGGGHGADAAEPDLVDAEGIGAAESGADVVGAADVVKNDDEAAARLATAVLFGAHAAEFDIEEFAIFHSGSKDSHFFLGNRRILPIFVVNHALWH